MNTEDINKILQEFDNIEIISPSEQWEIVFEQKLKHSKISKTNKTTKLNVALFFLVFINMGIILNSFRTETIKTQVSRQNNLKSIANELLISN